MVSLPPECTFHRTLADAARTARFHDAEVYDAHGLWITRSETGFEAGLARPDHLAELLRRWLGHADALRESTATWPLWLLVQAAVDHAGYSE